MELPLNLVRWTDSIRIRRCNCADKREDGSVLDIKIEETDEYTLCSPSGELDAYTVGAFREALGKLAGHSRVFIDLSAVPFMDSAGLGALINGIRKAREAEGEIAVVCDRPALSRLLHTTGFDRIVPVTESIEEAIEALDETDEDE